MCVNNSSKVALDSAVAGIWTRNLQSQVQCPNHCATKHFDKSQYVLLKKSKFPRGGITSLPLIMTRKNNTVKPLISAFKTNTVKPLISAFKRYEIISAPLILAVSLALGSIREVTVYCSNIHNPLFWQSNRGRDIRKI